MRAEQRRGFGRERHTAFKLGVSLAAFAGFVIAWAGFARAGKDAPPRPAITTAPASSAPATPAMATPRPRMSRGS